VTWHYSTKGGNFIRWNSKL
jgi:hypothetical protein